MLSSRGGLEDNRKYGLVSRLSSEIKSGIRRQYGVDVDDNGLPIDERLDVVSLYVSQNIAFLDRQERERIFNTLGSLAGRLEKAEAKIEQQRQYGEAERTQHGRETDELKKEMDKLKADLSSTKNQRPQQPTKEVPQERPLNYLSQCMFNGPEEAIEHKIEDGKRYRRCLKAYDAHWSRGERLFPLWVVSTEELKKRGCPEEGLNGWRLGATLGLGPILGTVFGNHPKDRCPLATGEWVEMD